MKVFIIINLFLSSLPSLTVAAPIPAFGAFGGAAKGAATGGNTGGTTGAANESPTQAAQNWMKDTGTVSAFLNQAPTLTGAQFTAQAKTALAAEKDELNHKAVLDNAKGIGNTANVKAANNILATQGTFQDVVDLLQDMVTNGDSVAVTDTNSINANRCKNVLPSIDKYLAAAGTTLTAVRPTVCDSTGVISQAQGSTTAAGTSTSTAAGTNTGNGSGTGTGTATGSDTGAGTNAGTDTSTATGTGTNTSTGTGAGTDAASATGGKATSKGGAGAGGFLGALTGGRKKGANK